MDFSSLLGGMGGGGGGGGMPSSSATATTSQNMGNDSYVYATNLTPAAPPAQAGSMASMFGGLNLNLIVIAAIGLVAVIFLTRK